MNVRPLAVGVARPAAFGLTAKTNGFAQAQVQSGIGGPGAVVDGNISGNYGCDRERSARGAYRAYAVREPGPVIKDRISVVIETGRKVIGLAGVDDHKRANGEGTREENITADKSPMTDIEGGAAVIGHGIELIGEKVGEAFNAA
jgi:hypothetical protein